MKRKPRDLSAWSFDQSIPGPAYVVLTRRQVPFRSLFVEQLEDRRMMFATYVGQGDPNGVWGTTNLSYSYSNFLDNAAGWATGLSRVDMQNAIEEAMGIWTAVSPLRFFARVDSGPPPDDTPYDAGSHPTIRWGHHFIDGQPTMPPFGNVLAHALRPGTGGLNGDPHYDDGNTWMLLVRGINVLSELNACEAENIRAAVVKYLAAKPSKRTAPFTLTWILKLHEEMFGKVWSYAGKTRLSNIIIGIAWEHVTVQLLEMLGDLVYRERAWPDVIEQAAYLHHRAVEIHPFLGGNGRWSRLLANIWLKQHDQSPTLWPEEAINTTSPIREEYLATLHKADEGDKAAIVELHRRYTATTISR